MKVFPTRRIRRSIKEPELTKMQVVTRIIALVVALISVYIFFFKILFF